MTDSEAERVFEEYRSLARAIEEVHPGCLRRWDRWPSGDAYAHGFIGGRKCPASAHHVRRRELLKRVLELYLAQPTTAEARP